MPFEKWVKKGKKITRPFVTLDRDGQLYLSKSCEELLDFADYVTLWFDAKTRQAGLRPAQPDEEAVYRVSRHTRTGRASVSAMSFCRGHGIDVYHGGKFFVKQVKDMAVFWVGGGEQEDEDDALSSD